MGLNSNCLGNEGKCVFNGKKKIGKRQNLLASVTRFLFSMVRTRLNHNVYNIINDIPAELGTLFTASLQPSLICLIGLFLSLILVARTPVYQHHSPQNLFVVYEVSTINSAVLH